MHITKKAFENVNSEIEVIRSTLKRLIRKKN